MIEVAAYPEMHPQAANPTADFENFWRKVEAGADAALDATVLQRRRVFPFRGSLRRRQASRFRLFPASCRSPALRTSVRFCGGCGADLPRWIRLRLEELEDDKPALAGLWRGSCDAVVRDAAARRRARIAFLHHQPGGAHDAAVEESFIVSACIKRTSSECCVKVSRAASWASHVPKAKLMHPFIVHWTDVRRFVPVTSHSCVNHVHE